MHRKGHRMKHLRKTAAVLLALALVLALAACGKAPKNTANNNNNAAEPENAAVLAGLLAFVHTTKIDN